MYVTFLWDFNVSQVCASFHRKLWFRHEMFLWYFRREGREVFFQVLYNHSTQMLLELVSNSQPPLKLAAELVLLVLPYYSNLQNASVLAPFLLPCWITVIFEEESGCLASTAWKVSVPPKAPPLTHQCKSYHNGKWSHLMNAMLPDDFSSPPRGKTKKTLENHLSVFWGRV